MPIVTTPVLERSTNNIINAVTPYNELNLRAQNLADDLVAFVEDLGTDIEAAGAAIDAAVIQTAADVETTTLAKDQAVAAHLLAEAAQSGAEAARAAAEGFALASEAGQAAAENSALAAEAAQVAAEAAAASAAMHLTEVGGYAVQMVNATGAPSVHGTLVMASADVDFGVAVATGLTLSPVGVMYSDGVANGELVWVVVAGAADVLLKDGTAAGRGNWVVTSDVAGRADATATLPPGGTQQSTEAHFREVGHCIQGVSAGTAALARCLVHFN
jgi:hypothetical protein